ncbi:PQQ-dependent sugar dehydrogenase [Mycobacterium sp. OAE908]|uniref:PQQ-dependent sugar dehydrogenase n=1 Tax=Mycobacterium sp. OAE908 TaxID=2817899 RepID=UPI001AE343E9
MTSTKRSSDHLRQTALQTPAAKFIGRVGALAVALGVGGALATSPGVALADDTSSTSSSSSDSTSTAGSSGTNSTTSSTTDQTTGSASEANSPTHDDGPVVHISGGVDKSDDGGGTSGGEELPSTDPRKPESDEPATTEETNAEAPHRKKGDRPSASAATAETDIEHRAVPTTDATSHESTAPEESPADKPTEQPTPATISVPEAATQTAVTTFSAAAVQQPVGGQQSRITSLPGAIIGLASDLIHSALAAIVGPDPGAPGDSPLLWGLLGWVRRQLSAQFSDQTPTVDAAQTALALDAAETGLPEDLERTIIASGLNEPTDMRFLPDGSILITEKSGAIRVFKNGQLQDQPLITIPTKTGGERGVTAVEVDPNFTTNHYIYVAYTGIDDHEKLSRLTVTGYTGGPGIDSLSVDANSEKILLASDQVAGNIHQGGGLAFGPDGKFYWSLGDNSNSSNSQNLSTIQGKILRFTINPDGTISTPADNPFVNTQGANPLIYALGFRNPFRFVFTPNGTLLEGDVGGTAWEELNVITRGANYGWPLAEGFCNNCGYANPIYAYPHTPLPEKAGAITAVMFYTGTKLGAEYDNTVFIADYTRGFIRALTFDSNFTSLIHEHTFDDAAGTPIKLMQGPDGNIYQLNIYPGELSIIAPSGGNRAPTAVVTATPAYGKPAPLTVDFSSQGSSDPEGSQLSYSWNFGDNTTSSDANPTHTYAANGTYVATLTVSDGEKTAQASQQIFVGNTAPSVQITSPVDESKYNAGNTISFSGIATDDEDGTLPDSAYRWTVVFHHADHIHPFADNIVGKSGSIEIPTDSSQVDTTWYEISLTVTDSKGLASTQSVEVRPNLVNVSYSANNPNVVFTIDGIPYQGSYSEQGVVGVKHVLGALSPQADGADQLVFSRWSDGGAQQHTITTPGSDTSYSVTFDTYVPHATFAGGAILKQLQQNLSETFAHLGTALRTSAGAVVDIVTGLPAAALDAVAHPTHIPSIISGLFNDARNAGAPVAHAITDIVTTTANRAAAVASAVAANVGPLSHAIVDAPAGIGAALKDSASLLLTFLMRTDAEGFIGALRYAQQTVQGELQHHVSDIVGSVADLQHDIVDALATPQP